MATFDAPGPNQAATLRLVHVDGRVVAQARRGTAHLQLGAVVGWIDAGHYLAAPATCGNLAIVPADGTW